MSAVVKSKGGVSGKVGVMECFCSAGPSLIMFLTDFKSTGIKKERKKKSLTVDLWESGLFFSLERTQIKLWQGAMLGMGDSHDISPVCERRRKQPKKERKKDGSRFYTEIVLRRGGRTLIYFLLNTHMFRELRRM